MENYSVLCEKLCVLCGNKELQTATLPEKIEQIRSRIGYCEDKVNEIVYELYGLSEEEVGVVEK